MNPRHDPQAELFRLWIVRYYDWRPTHWNERPPRATALCPMEDAVYSSEEATLLLEGFNGWIVQNQNVASGQQDRRWAIAVPVRLVYEGDLVEGEVVN